MVVDFPFLQGVIQIPSIVLMKTCAPTGLSQGVRPAGKVFPREDLTPAGIKSAVAYLNLQGQALVVALAGEIIRRGLGLRPMELDATGSEE